MARDCGPKSCMLKTDVVSQQLCAIFFTYLCSEQQSLYCHIKNFEIQISKANPGMFLQPPSDTWECPKGCGKSMNVTAKSAIIKHLQSCGEDPLQKVI